MSYKRYVFMLILSVVLVIIAVPPILYCLVAGKGCEAGRELAEWWQVKESYAQSIDTPKMVILSGSNTLFGVDCQRMEKELEIPVVNLGTHAELIFYYFERVKRSLGSGDIVICPVEYAFYDANRHNAGLVRFIRSYDSAYIANLPLDERLAYIYKVNFYNLLEDVSELVREPVRRESSYSAKYLNLNGDMENNLYDKKNPPEQSEPFDGNNEEIPSADVMRTIFEFASYCKENDIKFYAAYPVFMCEEGKFSGKSLQRVNDIEKFYGSIGVKVLGQYSDTLYKRDMFYDTVYHLNDKGKAKHTEYLLSLLKKEIGGEIEEMRSAKLRVSR